MGHFLSDLERSRVAVNLLMKRYRADGHVVREFETKEEQKLGDFRIDDSFNVEVKFDEMAAKTGNFCFEMSNGSKMTGVMTTPADKIVYVLPDGDKYRAYVFNPTKLRAFITDAANVIIKNGGDRKKFVLALAKIAKVVDANLPEEIIDLV